MWGFVLAAIVLALGIAAPEIWRRRRLAKIRLKPEKQEPLTSTAAAIAALRTDLLIAIEGLRTGLLVAVWQAEAVTLAALLSIAQALAL